MTAVPLGATATAARAPARRWLAAFIRRDWRIARSYRLQFLLEICAVPIALGMLYFLGRLVDQGSLPSDGSFSQGYFAFAAVGFAVLGMAQSALSSFSSRLRTEQTTGTFEALLSSPVSPSVVVVGSAAFDLLRATVGAGATVLVAVLFGLRLHLSLGTAVSVLVGLPALVATFAAVGVVVASCAVVFKQVTALLGMVTTVIALLAGVYFPVDVLPGPLQVLANLLPFTWGIDVLRAGLLQGEVAGGRLGLLVGFAVVSLPLALWLFGHAVDFARRQGTLTQF
ncbi:MAG TPA: ABC transporter permease [Acidimicrobiales bacterium]|nr:ABC transporter permease [Acidimicrobiales bacterium]